MNWQHQKVVTQREQNKIKDDSEDDDFSECGEAEECVQVDNEQGQGVDPLDEYMNSLNTAGKDDRIAVNEGRDSAEDSQFNQQEENNPVEERGQFEDEIDPEADGSVQDEVAQRGKGKKTMETLPAFDFSQVRLQEFSKDFYVQHEEIANLAEQELAKILKNLEIHASGSRVPRPIVSFGHLALHQRMNRLIVKCSYEVPTPIQAIALPCALSGRDVVGIAKTGSGKTLAYVWPMIVHAEHRWRACKGDGPVGLVLAPTRELCQQIYIQTRKFSKKNEMKIGCLLGGENKHEQWKHLKSGIDILIASPGRLIEMLKKKATSLQRVTYLVLDEADRMLSLGFQTQIRSIVGHTRPDRQTLLFTATMKKSMQFLLEDVVTNPIKIIVGEEGAANEDVRQEVVKTSDREEKMAWIQGKAQDLLLEGKIIIFANQRQTCQEIGRKLQQSGIAALVLHGDKNQYQRTVIMNAFKADASLLVATDIAARGIDVRNIKTVVNFECPKSIEAYVHRIGRAGRAGETGVAYSLLTNSDAKFAIQLIRTFQNSGYPVSAELEEIACLNDMFRRKRLSAKMGVSFAKGKDAAKLLNQALKQQRRTHSRAGLGSEEVPANGIRLREENEEGLISQQINDSSLSIAQISSLIREKYIRAQGEQKYGKFVKSQKDTAKAEEEVTVSYYDSKKRNGNRSSE